MADKDPHNSTTSSYLQRPLRSLAEARADVRGGRSLWGRLSRVVGKGSAESATGNDKEAGK